MIRNVLNFKFLLLAVVKRESICEKHSGERIGMALNCDFEGIDNDLLVRRGNNSSLRVRRCDIPLQVDTGNNVIANKSNLSNFSRYSI